MPGGQQEVDANHGEEQEAEGDDRQDHDATATHLGPEPGVQKAAKISHMIGRAQDLGIAPAQDGRSTAAGSAFEVQQNADQEAEGQEGKGERDGHAVQAFGLLEVRQLETLGGLLFELQPSGLEQVHEPGEKATQVKRAPRIRKTPWIVPQTGVQEAQVGDWGRMPVRPARAERTTAIGSTKMPMATDRGTLTIRYRAMAANIQERTTRKSNWVAMLELVLAERQVQEVGGVNQPAEGQQGDCQEPAAGPAHDEAGKVASKGQAIGSRETQDTESIHARGWLSVGAKGARVGGVSCHHAMIWTCRHAALSATPLTLIVANPWPSVRLPPGSVPGRIPLDAAVRLGP